MPTPQYRYPPKMMSTPATQPSGSHAPPVTVGERMKNKDVGVDAVVREVMRTPSPTPSEIRVLNEKSRMCNWGRISNLKRYMNKRGVWTLAVMFAIVLFIALFLAYQNKLIDLLRPAAIWMRETPGGWLIPIAIMFIMSFPPLFGHEIIGIICGDVWGPWIGFGIVAAGTLLGELGNFIAFKWWCLARGKRMEKNTITYALYAQVVREGGLLMPVIMRYSIIPGHFLTAIFATAGMSIWVFLASATLSLPKQLAVVFLGAGRDDDNGGQKETLIKVFVVLVTAGMTIIAMRYVNRRMDKVKADVVYARRRARRAKAPATVSQSEGGETGVNSTRQPPESIPPRQRQSISILREDVEANNLQSVWRVPYMSTPLETVEMSVIAPRSRDVEYLDAS